MTLHARSKSTIRGKVSHRQGAPDVGGKINPAGPQDSTAALAGKKRRSAAETLYPSMPKLKE